MSHIFISYSHKDSDYAHKLAEVIESLHFEVWIDDRIDYGTQWPKAIEEAVNSCDAFVVVMTPRSLESIWVQNELVHAMDLKKTIFPLLLEGDPWLSIKTIQYADVRGTNLPPVDFITKIIGVVMEQRVKRGEKPSSVIWLSKILQGRELLSLASGAHVLRPNYDSPDDQEQMEMTKRFLQEVEDLDILDELGSNVAVETEYRLSQLLDELMRQGLYVYATRAKVDARFGQFVLKNADTLFVVVTKQNQMIIFLDLPNDD